MASCFVILEHFHYHQKHLKTKEIVTYMSLLNTQLLSYISISNNGKQSICIKCVWICISAKLPQKLQTSISTVQGQEKSYFLFQPVPFPAFDYSFWEVFQCNNQFHSTPRHAPCFFNPSLNVFQKLYKQGLVRLQKFRKPQCNEQSWASEAEIPIKHTKPEDHCNIHNQSQTHWM